MHFDPAEKLLGMCLREPRVFEEAVRAGITPASFVDQKDQRIFVAMLAAERAGRPFDVAHLQLALPDLAVRLVDLRSEAPVTMNASYFTAELLSDEWARRASRTMQELSRDLMARVPFSETTALRERVSAVLEGLAVEGASSKGLKSISEVLDLAMPAIEQRVIEARSGKGSEIPTGIAYLDRLTSGGMRRGSVNVFAARTGMGKTTLALNLCHNAATAGFAVGYFTVEMPATQLAYKLLSLVSAVKGASILKGTLSEKDLDDVHAAANALHKRPIFIDDNFMASFEAFERSCRKRKRRGPLDVVVVDYVQQLSTASKHQSRHAMVGEVSHRLKQLALELEIAVISLAQFNRDAEKEDVPSIWQIKDSGAIEQDADLAVCLYRDSKDRFWLKVDKNRWGRDRVQFPIDAELSINVFRNAVLSMPEDF